MREGEVNLLELTEAADARLPDGTPSPSFSKSLSSPLTLVGSLCVTPVPFPSSPVPPTAGTNHQAVITPISSNDGAALALARTSTK